jgi:hypothetical protein
MSGLVWGMQCCRRSIQRGSVHNFHQPVSYCGFGDGFQLGLLLHLLWIGSMMPGIDQYGPLGSV